MNLESWRNMYHTNRVYQTQKVAAMRSIMSSSLVSIFLLAFWHSIGGGTLRGYRSKHFTDINDDQYRIMGGVNTISDLNGNYDTLASTSPTKIHTKSKGKLKTICDKNEKSRDMEYNFIMYLGDQNK